MSQDVYLLTCDSPLFPAHWSIWVPSHRFGPGGDQNPLGKVIQVVGDLREGFEHEFKRNYELEGTGRRYHKFLLASVPEAFVVDVVGDGSFTTDKVAVDVIERCALSVPAPGKSLKPVDGKARRANISVQNCQTWLTQLVAKLVEENIFPESANQVVRDAPKN